MHFEAETVVAARPAICHASVAPVMASIRIFPEVSHNRKQDVAMDALSSRALAFALDADAV